MVHTLRCRSVRDHRDPFHASALFRAQKQRREGKGPCLTDAAHFTLSRRPVRVFAAMRWSEGAPSHSAALTCCTFAMAAAADLYRAQTIVTGQGEANRIIGFASCLEDVLIKVSGALNLAGDPRLAAYKSRAADFVSAYRYHDQMSGTPTRDEQGTRDRPYDLIVDFDETKIGDLLSALGLKPWPSHRPVLAVLVEMEQGARKYIVTSD